MTLILLQKHLREFFWYESFNQSAPSENYRSGDPEKNSFKLYFYIYKDLEVNQVEWDVKRSK